MPEQSPDEPAGAFAEPTQARTRRAFLEALARRRVLSGDTFKQLELRSGVPRSTLSDMLTRHRVPRREVVERVIGVYAASKAEAHLWTGVWSRLSLEEALPMESPAPAALEPPSGRADESVAPRAQRRTRWVLAGLLGAATIGVLVAAVAALPPTSGTAQPTASGAVAPGPSAPSTAAPAPGRFLVALRVYNVEADCRRPRTETCALRLAHDPRAVPSVGNRAGEVWHGDEVLAACVIADGRAVTDEKLRSSRSWYFVRVPATAEVGWLPGIRVRPQVEVRPC